MKQPQPIYAFETERLLKYYRRYRLVRWLLLNPVIRLLAFVVGSLLLIVLWPIAFIYIVIKSIRHNRRTHNKHLRRHQDIIDL